VYLVGRGKTLASLLVWSMD